MNWPAQPALLSAHPFGGSQDPCLLQLRNGTILCASYGWAFPNADALAKIKTPYFKTGDAVFPGGYLLRSTDNGKTRSAPVYPPSVPDEIHYSLYGNKVPAYNRGALFEGRNGTIYRVVAATDDARTLKTSNYLLTSKDGGKSWAYQSVVAKDPRIVFNETSIYETPKGDLVAFMRTGNAGDTAYIARSKDGGSTFTWRPCSKAPADPAGCHLIRLHFQQRICRGRMHIGVIPRQPAVAEQRILLQQPFPAGLCAL
ncbi:BNR repeat-like domain-containing protein [Niabella drilacis]|uniref:BNR repeat-like domain-containing protein n=1 Tax=Niabella drilacis (strain DSM 25811 / CCM 8410 / CCUG 62505 / LMG 26954 / E90) TaxID=1285928 RepID=A0A1G6Y114_NIADE|nr:sialidase family protein [Niabella drilacis]SDD84000.1 BNR repeat-like domain-containing protein [Niabella drilacis]